MLSSRELPTPNFDNANDSELTYAYAFAQVGITAGARLHVRRLGMSSTITSAWACGVRLPLTWWWWWRVGIAANRAGTAVDENGSPFHRYRGASG